MIRRRWQWGIVALLTGLAVVALPAGFVSIAEERNVFCASCHLRPEQMYYERSLVKARNDAVDLASTHTLAGVSCVGCHRGDQGPVARSMALALGARNTVRFVTGQYDPNHSRVAVRTLLDDGCRYCHVTRPELGGVKSGEVNPVTLQDFDNHFHALLFDPRIKTSVTCISCHTAHHESFPEFLFLDRNQVVLPACEQCHREAGRGPASGLR
jgi:hypothetical protein